MSTKQAKTNTRKVKNTKESKIKICKENLENENFPCIKHLFKFAEKTQREEPINLGYWIYNFSVVLFKFIYDYEKNIKANYNKNAQPFSLFLKENLKQNEIDFIVNTDQYKRFSKQFDIVKANEKIKVIADKKLKNKEILKADKEQKEHENKINKAKQDYILGTKINSELFLELCKIHNIALPLKTLGWCISSLHTISCKTYTWIKKNKTSKQSNSIYKYMEFLENEIKKYLQPKFCFIHFAIYYLIANLEQEKQVEKIVENCNKILAKRKQDTFKINLNRAFNSVIYDNKPAQNLLPVLYTPEQKTPVKSTNKPLQIELKKQVLSLPTLQEQNIINYSQMIQKIDKDIILTLPAAKIEQIELVDYTEITEIHKEGNIRVCGGLDNFYELYYARLKEKRAIRKANSKIAGIFNRIMQFSAAAVLCFLFVSTYFNIQKTNLVMDNIAKIETVNPTAVNMANLSDCNNGGIIQIKRFFIMF